MRALKDFSFEEEPGRLLEKPLKSNMEQDENHIPAISVVTPFYNSDKFIEQTFRCVMNQTLEDFEWIIINDGSTRKEAVAILENLEKQDTRIHIIHQENAGQSIAKNNGIRHCKSEIVLFLDADDLVEKFYFEVLYHALQEHKDASWSYTDLVGFGSWNYIWCKPFSAGRMTFNNTLVNAAAFRKSALVEVKGFPEEYKHYDEDWALYLKLLGAGHHPVHVPVIGFWYRRSDTGMQQTVRKDEDLRQKSDAYMEELSKSVNVYIQGEEYQGKLPEDAVITCYSKKEKLISKLLSNKLGVTLVSNIYKRKRK